MASKSTVLNSLTRARLLDIAQECGIKGLSAKSKEEVLAALSGASIRPVDLLSVLLRDELKAACREAGLSDAGRAKQEIVERLLGAMSGDRAALAKIRAAAPAPAPAPAPARGRKGQGPKEPTAETYKHPEAESLLRPDVGTQAQFKKRKQWPNKNSNKR